MFSLFSIYINDTSAATKGPESKKPNGSQIIRIGMGIYRKIAVLASFNVLVSQVLRRRHEKTRLYYAARKKSPNFPSFHSNRSQSSLEYGPKILFPSLKRSI